MLVTVCMALGAPRRGLQLVWELNLNRYIREPKNLLGSSPHSVLDLSFSPDETRIALDVGLHPTPISGRRRYQDDHASHLLIVDISQPQVGVKQFDPGVFVLGQDAELQNIRWSPKSDFVALAGYPKRVIVRIDNGHVCEIVPPDVGLGGFLDDSRLLVYGTGRKLTSFHIVDTECKLLNTWSTENEFGHMDTSPHLGLLAARQNVMDDRVDFVVIQARTKEIIQRWSGEVMRGQVRFADSGKAICAASRADSTPERSPVICADAKTGTKIAEHPTVNGGGPFSAATQGSVLALSDYKFVRGIIEDMNHVTLKPRVIWNFRTGRELASWKPGWQTSEDPVPRPGLKEPVPFALSPTGKYVAEGGDGVLRLYKVE